MCDISTGENQTVQIQCHWRREKHQPFVAKLDFSGIYQTFTIQSQKGVILHLQKIQFTF